MRRRIAESYHLAAARSTFFRRCLPCQRNASAGQRNSGSGRSSPQILKEMWPRSGAPAPRSWSRSCPAPRSMRMSSKRDEAWLRAVPCISALRLCSHSPCRHLRPLRPPRGGLRRPLSPGLHAAPETSRAADYDAWRRRDSDAKPKPMPQPMLPKTFGCK